uniref:(northern house mosquito) hypothetical protein n=1 Tax=Culex pipiens TaxID=7175 RepID=A0A8D8BL64_CULPI
MYRTRVRQRPSSHPAPQAGNPPRNPPTSLTACTAIPRRSASTRRSAGGRPNIWSRSSASSRRSSCGWLRSAKRRPKRLRKLPRQNRWPKNLPSKAKPRTTARTPLRRSTCSRRLPARAIPLRPSRVNLRQRPAPDCSKIRWWPPPRQLPSPNLQAKRRKRKKRPNPRRKVAKRQRKPTACKRPYRSCLRSPSPSNRCQWFNPFFHPGSSRWVVPPRPSNSSALRTISSAPTRRPHDEPPKHPPRLPTVARAKLVRWPWTTVIRFHPRHRRRLPRRIPSRTRRCRSPSQTSTPPPRPKRWPTTTATRTTMEPSARCQPAHLPKFPWRFSNSSRPRPRSRKSSPPSDQQVVPRKTRTPPRPSTSASRTKRRRRQQQQRFKPLPPRQPLLRSSSRPCFRLPQVSNSCPRSGPCPSTTSGTSGRRCPSCTIS